MKLKWSEMKQLTSSALGIFDYQRCESFHTGVTSMYNEYRGSVDPRGPEPGLAAEAAWNTDAREFVEPKIRVDLRSVPKAEREEKGWPKDYFWGVAQVYGFSRSLMIEADGEIWFGKDVPANGHIHAVQVTLTHFVNERSRLNLIVRPECAGHPLQRKLFALSIALTHTKCSSSGALCQWKVMSPKLGITGPESAVLYLNAPFEDAKVKQLIIELEAFLHGDLVALRSCPFGLIKIANGIYGCELPGEDIEKRVFGMTSKGSAGQLMSMIACKAAWETAEEIFHGKNARKTTEEEEERCLRAQFARVLKELGWELEG